MDGLLTVKQAAKYLQIHPQTLYKKGEIPRKKILGGIRFKESELDRYLEQSTIRPPISSISPELRRLAKNAKMNQKGGNCAVSKKKQRWNYGRGFGGIFIRKSSKGEERFNIWFYDENGVRQRKVIKEARNKEQAEIAFYSEIQKVFDRKYNVGEEEKKISFIDFAKQYLETHAKPQKRSWKNDEKHLKNHLIPFFGDMDLSEITPLHVKSFIAEKLKEGLQKNSINRYLQVMRMMINVACDYGYKVNKNPVRQRDLFREDEFRRTRILSHEEEKSLLKEACPHLRPIIQFALETGCRLQEALKLQKDDLDFKNGLIVIRPEINKSGRRDIIPMSSTLRTLLKKLILASDECNRVFNYFDRAKSKIRPLNSIYKGFRRACERAGIKDLQFRDLRRTFSTRLHSKDVDPLKIQRLLHHSNFRVTEQHYIQSEMEQLRAAVEKLNGKEPNKPKDQDKLALGWHAADCRFRNDLFSTV